MIIAVYFIKVFIETFLSFGLSISFNLKVTNTDDFTHILKNEIKSNLGYTLYLISNLT